MPIPLPTLVDLSVKQFAYSLVDGSSPKYNYKLNTELSNKVFQKLCHEGYIFTSKELVNEINDKLNISRMDLYVQKISQFDIKLLWSHKLTSLTLGDFTESGRSEVDFDVGQYLMKALNPKTQQRLQHLGVSGFDTNFVEGWTTKFSFPSLKTLLISGRLLAEIDFNNICHDFKGLQILDISNTTFPNLNGISNLSNLESLAIGGLQFSKEEHLIEIFELKKLKVLDLGCKWFCECRDRPLLRLFLNCKKVLPELKFIDCFGNFAIDNLVIQLVITHPTLQKIGLLRTDSNFFSVPGIDILSTTTLLSASQALNHYVSSKNDIMPDEIMDIMYGKLKDTFGTRDRNDLRDWFFALCRVLTTFPHHYDLQNKATRCLRQFSLNDFMATSLDTSERKQLSDILFATCDRWSDHHKEFKTAYKINKNIWWMLTNPAFLRLPGLNLKEVFQYGLEYLEMKRYTVLEFCCCQAMSKALTFMSPTEKEQVYGDVEMWKRVVSLLKPAFKKSKKEMYFFYIRLLEKLAQNSAETFVAAGAPEIIIRHWRRFHFDKMASVMASFMNNDYKEFLKTYNIQNLVRLLGKLTVNVDKFNESKQFKEKIYSIASILTKLMVMSPENVCWNIVDNYLKTIFKKLSHSEPFNLKMSNESFMRSFIYMCVESKTNGPFFLALWTIAQKVKHHGLIFQSNTLYFNAVKSLYNRNDELRVMSEEVLTLCGHL